MQVLKRTYNILLIKRKVYNIVFTRLYSLFFFNFGKHSLIGCNSTYLGIGRISIGEQTRIGRYAVITAWEKINKEVFSPQIVIGNDCAIGEFVHITAINSITIGNNVLMGRRVTITDNSHGINSSIAELQLPPNQRKLYSKGPVVIEDNVWIGDKATILAGVKIGYGSIVGANAVVTKDVPAYSIVGGIPAKVLRTINK